MEQDTDDKGVDGMMRTVVEANLLKYGAGQNIWCPNCQCCMDWRDTVIATIHACKNGDKDNEQSVKAYTVCGKCWDRLGGHVVDGVDKANVKLAGRMTARLELVDGREKRFDDLED